MKFHQLFELTVPEPTTDSHTPFSPYWDRAFHAINFPTELLLGERYGVGIIGEEGCVTSDQVMAFISEHQEKFFFGGVQGINLVLRNETFWQKLPRTPVVVTDARQTFVQRSISPPRNEMHHVPGFYPMTGQGETAWRVRMYERDDIWPRGFVHLLFARL